MEKNECDIRKIDNLGRICIPTKYRKKYNIQDNDQIEIINTSDGILLKKHIKKINYEDLLHSLLSIKFGKEYDTYLLTKNDITSFENYISDYIKKNY